MANRYFCRNENRRDAVRFTTDGGGNPVQNGIDYLEVSEDQLTLLVHFIHPLPGEAGAVPPSPAPALDAQNFTIRGGVRVTNVRITSIATADRVVTLAVDTRGDFSTYALHLVVSADEDEPPGGFDPQLSVVGFSFKVECPGDFDCKPADECPPEQLPAPLIDYLAKDFGSFRRLMLDRMAVIMPDWRERNPADTGIALVEAIAYAADSLSYYQDAVGTEAYLGTARQRVSIRRHARLLDYFTHDGCNARAWVFVETEPGGAAEGATLEAGTKFLTRGTDNAVIVNGGALDLALKEKPVVFESTHRLTLHGAHNEIHLYTWSDTECCLPKGATRCTLRNDTALSLQAGDLLLFEEVISPATGNPADADPAHRRVVRLTRVVTEDESHQPLRDQLTGAAIAEIEWDVEDALPFPLCISTKIALPTGDQFIDNASVARGNVVLADHGLSVNEGIGTIGSNAAGRPDQPVLMYFPLTQQGRARDTLNRPVLDSDGEPALFDPLAPAVGAFRWQMRDVLPGIFLVENGDKANPWLPRHDLLGSGRFQKHFVVETDNDGRAHLRFGDGLHGTLPGAHSTFEARYRVGNGPSGNVGARALTRIVTTLGGITHVRNPLPAGGGGDPESLEEVRQYAPQAFRTQERAVTEADYAEVAERYPETENAEATLRWTGSWHTVFVTVDRKRNRPIDAPFEDTLRTFLERFRLAGEDLEVDAPRFVSLDIVFTVCVKPGYLRSQVREELLRCFGNRDLPDGTRGFFHPDNLTFGQTLYLSQLIALAMGVPGVQWVDAEDVPSKPNRFRRWGEPSHGEFTAGKITFGRLEIPRCDNDRDRPENGKIDFIMKGGL